MGAILLVEDNPELAEVMQTVLEDEGHEVLSTPSGLHGVVLTTQRPFDLVVLDLQVEDLSGVGALRAMRDMKALPVLAMSAQRNGWRREALEQGAAACLSKPFHVSSLLSLVDTVLKAEQPGGGQGFSGDVQRLGPEDMDRLRRMSDQQLDSLPFGAIRVDEEGRIRAFNTYEAQAAHLSPQTVVGMSIYDVAPCLAVKEFLEAVARVKQGERVDESLRFVFPRGGNALAVVTVRLFFDAALGNTWVFISKRAEGDAQASDTQPASVPSDASPSGNS